MQENEKGEILIYKTEAGETEIEVQLSNSDVWLTQEQLAQLYQSAKSTISYHITKILESEELSEFSVVRKFRTTATDGKIYDTKYYNLSMVIAIGYRVNASRGIHFRQWATKILGEYLVKGFVMDDARLANEKKGYFDELFERVIRIRTSEKNFYLKVRDIFATRTMKIFRPQGDFNLSLIFFLPIEPHPKAWLPIFFWVSQ
jgi:hypothetical protein